MTSVSRNMHINKLDDVVNKYNNTYSTIKIKPLDVKSRAYINSIKEINDEGPKIKIGDIVRISKYKNICKMLCSKLLRKGFCYSKKLCCGHMLLVISKVKKFLEGFTKKNCKKHVKKSLELKK